jgi:hypothetical protein
MLMAYPSAPSRVDIGRTLSIERKQREHPDLLRDSAHVMQRGQMKVLRELL